VERAHVRVAEQERGLLHPEPLLAQVTLRELAAQIVDEILEARPLVFQAPLQRAPGQRERVGGFVDRRSAVRKPQRDEPLYAQSEGLSGGQALDQAARVGQEHLRERGVRGEHR
jgi:hypothetical protein